MDFVRIDIFDPMATLTLDRQEALNTLTPDVLDELSRSLDEVNTGEVQVREAEEMLEGV